jgi:hypothetical protein
MLSQWHTIRFSRSVRLIPPLLDLLDLLDRAGTQTFPLGHRSLHLPKQHPQSTPKFPCFSWWHQQLPHVEIILFASLTLVTFQRIKACVSHRTGASLVVISTALAYHKEAGTSSEAGKAVDRNRLLHGRRGEEARFYLRLLLGSSVYST